MKNILNFLTKKFLLFKILEVIHCRLASIKCKLKGSLSSSVNVYLKNIPVILENIHNRLTLIEKEQDRFVNEINSLRSHLNKFFELSNNCQENAPKNHLKE